jgi:phenylpyruvate tautomerase PptA (4-oxalocrotonate tautomerase family)
MPLITIKVFENELSNSQAKDLIHKVTEAVIPFVGEKLPDNTWVLIEEIASGS